MKTKEPEQIEIENCEKELALANEKLNTFAKRFYSPTLDDGLNCATCNEELDLCKAHARLCEVKLECAQKALELKRITSAHAEAHKAFMEACEYDARRNREREETEAFLNSLES